MDLGRAPAACYLDRDGRFKRNGAHERINMLRMEAEIVGDPVRPDKRYLSRRKKAWIRSATKELVLRGVPYLRARALSIWSLARFGNIDVDWLARGEA